MDRYHVGLIGVHSSVIEDRVVHRYASLMGDRLEGGITRLPIIRNRVLKDKDGFPSERSILPNNQLPTALAWVEDVDVRTSVSRIIPRAVLGCDLEAIGSPILSNCPLISSVSRHVSSSIEIKLPSGGIVKWTHNPKHHRLKRF